MYDLESNNNSEMNEAQDVIDSQSNNGQSQHEDQNNNEARKKEINKLVSALSIQDKLYVLRKYYKESNQVRIVLDDLLVKMCYYYEDINDYSLDLIKDEDKTVILDDG
eukprot:Mrub_15749.p1 GENE.Mrub_15749~~Mrub_15749.p1  ORF type:complete len:108 (+),score=22.89 Mrub_15749:1-324(+)